MNNKPLISIIMGIYNCEKTLENSINSILNQTYKNFQLIMCDDHSSDNTYRIAKKYAGKYGDKIVLIRNNVNIGLAGSLNNCLKYVKGSYIARQDGDDISVENRLEKQIEFLLKNTKYDLVATSMISFNENGVNGIRGILPMIPNISKLAVHPPFCHATIMVKSEVYFKLNGYRVTKYTRRCEDIDLWFRFFKNGYKGVNLSEPLYMVRDDKDSYKRRNVKSYLYATKVCFDGYRLLKLPIYNYVYVLKPIATALIPTKLKKIYHTNLTKAN